MTVPACNCTAYSCVLTTVAIGFSAIHIALHCDSAYAVGSEQIYRRMQSKRTVTTRVDRIRMSGYRVCCSRVWLLCWSVSVWLCGTLDQLLVRRSAPTVIELLYCSQLAAAACANFIFLIGHLQTSGYWGWARSCKTELAGILETTSWWATGSPRLAQISLP